MTQSFSFRKINLASYSCGKFVSLDQSESRTQTFCIIKVNLTFIVARGHGGRVVTLSPPTSEAGVWFPARPQVGKLVVACCWSAVYSTEP